MDEFEDKLSSITFRNPNFVGVLRKLFKNILNDDFLKVKNYSLSHGCSEDFEEVYVKWDKCIMTVHLNLVEIGGDTFYLWQREKILGSIRKEL